MPRRGVVKKVKVGISQHSWANYEETFRMLSGWVCLVSQNAGKIQLSQKLKSWERELWRLHSKYI